MRFVQVGAIQAQLDMGNIVLLANLAFSTAGEVLNCNSFDVGTHAAIELQADKLCCLTLDEASVFALPQWLPLNDAEDLISRHMASEVCDFSVIVPLERASRFLICREKKFRLIFIVICQLHCLYCLAVQ